MVHVLIAVVTIVCAILAVRASRLLVSALWLAATSALVALEMYLLGAPEIAVIELSVGAGLVTILFVFAIN
ncbi:MAG: hydrogenase subunit MbhD domain-containing protein, partial [Bellilinea sp.]